MVRITQDDSIRVKMCYRQQNQSLETDLLDAENQTHMSGERLGEALSFWHTTVLLGASTSCILKLYKRHTELQPNLQNLRSSFTI